MIERRPKPDVPVSQPETPAGPSELLDVLLVEFHFDLGAAIGYTILPTDRLNVEEKIITVFLAARDEFGEETIEIDRTRVRWWSTRKGKIALPPKSFDPARA